MGTTPNNAITYWDPFKAPTGKAIAAVTGKRFVKFAAGGTVANPGVTPATADSRILGVAQNDAAIGETVLVNRQGAYSVKAGVALTAGDLVYSDSTGQAIKTGTNNVVGLCLADTASGSDAPILLFS